MRTVLLRGGLLIAVAATASGLTLKLTEKDKSTNPKIIGEAKKICNENNGILGFLRADPTPELHNACENFSDMTGRLDEMEKELQELQNAIESYSSLVIYCASSECKLTASEPVGE